MKNELTIKDLGIFAADKGFIYGPEPEIYNGLAGFYTYGPLGKLLKNNVENAIMETFISHEMYEVECPTIMPAIVWKASGHLGGFTERTIMCSKCKALFRIDHLIEENFKKPVPVKEQVEFLKKKNFKCPSCKGDFKWEVKEYNLMLKTTIGLDTEAYNRPETATTTYLPFIRYLDFFRGKVPFGVFQIGKAYRNELSPRQNVLRGREFTQAEGQIFIKKDQKKNFELFQKVKEVKLPFLAQWKKKVEEISLKEALKKGYLKTEAYAWTLALSYEIYLNMGISKKDIRFRQHEKEEKAFYADDAWDLEVNMRSLGWVEMCGIHDRTDYDLAQHEKFSGKKLRFEGERLHVLEIAFGSDRPCLALIDNAYSDDASRGNKILKFDPKIAPIKVGVFPLVNKLKERSYKVYEGLLGDFQVIYDYSGSIGRRYARADEIGIPYCVTVDFDFLEDETVTIRERDTTKQVRVKIGDLKETLRKLINKEIEFNRAGKEVK